MCLFCLNNPLAWHTYNVQGRGRGRGRGSGGLSSVPAVGISAPAAFISSMPMLCFVVVVIAVVASWA